MIEVSNIVTVHTSVQRIRDLLIVGFESGSHGTFVIDSYQGDAMTEYTRKLKVAAELADDTWLAGGLLAMEAELRFLRQNDADTTIIVELERLYHLQVVRTTPEIV